MLLGWQHPRCQQPAGKRLLYLGRGRCRGWPADSRDLGQGEDGGGGGYGKPPGWTALTPVPVCLVQVNVTVDYIRPASSATETVPAFSERTCATVSIGGM